ncbi:MAG TPA: hypothetical protein VGO00_20100 [Kofleriaceae bacterium]|jgi:hypothetical protein|nr:hypothetical protein [Kofleriaceae bacterium]
MTKFVIVASLVFGACGGSGVADELFKLKEEACACKDKKCAEDVNKRMDAALEKMKDPPDADTQKKIEQIMAGAGACLAKAMK